MFSTAVIQFSEYNLYDCDMLYIYLPVSLILLEKNTDIIKKIPDVIVFDGSLSCDIKCLVRLD